MAKQINALNEDIPRGVGRKLTAAERASILQAGRTVSGRAIVVRAVQDDPSLGVVYVPVDGGYSNTGILVGQLRPVGRPLLGTERRERYQVRLEPSLAEWLDQLGDGNRSAGIERAAKVAGYKP